MTIFVGIGKYSLLWRFNERDWQTDTHVIFEVLGKWGEHERGHRLILSRYSGLSDVSITYYIIHDDRRSGWQLQGPVRRVL